MLGLTLQMHQFSHVQDDQTLPPPPSLLWGSVYWLSVMTGEFDHGTCCPFVFSVYWVESLPHAQNKVISFVCSRKIAAIWIFFFLTTFLLRDVLPHLLRQVRLESPSVPEGVSGCSCTPRPPGGERAAALPYSAATLCTECHFRSQESSYFFTEPLTQNHKVVRPLTWMIGGILTHSLFFTHAH